MASCILRVFDLMANITGSNVLIINKSEMDYSRMLVPKSPVQA